MFRRIEKLIHKLPPKKYSTSADNSVHNVDVNELNRFRGLSKTWWDLSSDVKPLLMMNKLRVPFIRDGLINTGVIKAEFAESDKPLQGLKILDVGCGGGFLSEPLARLGATVTGLDAENELIEIAKSHKSTDNSLTSLEYVCSTIEEFSANHIDYFNAVVASEVIEHVPTKDSFVQHCVKTVKPGGSIFFTTISQTFSSQLFAVFLAEQVFHIVPKGTHEYEKFICPHDLQRLLEQNNSTTKRIHGLTMNPLTGIWRWVSCTDVNYALHAVKD